MALAWQNHVPGWNRRKQISLPSSIKNWEIVAHASSRDELNESNEGFKASSTGRAFNYTKENAFSRSQSHSKAAKWLVVDAALEACWAPVDKLDGALGLDGGHSSIHILRHHITTVHHAASHVLAVARVALDHHGGWLKHRHGDLCHRQLLVIGLLSGDHWGVGGQHEVDAGVRHQVGPCAQHQRNLKEHKQTQIPNSLPRQPEVEASKAYRISWASHSLHGSA